MVNGNMRRRVCGCGGSQRAAYERCRGDRAASARRHRLPTGGRGGAVRRGGLARRRRRRNLHGRRTSAALPPHVAAAAASTAGGAVERCSPRSLAAGPCLPHVALSLSSAGPLGSFSAVADPPPVLVNTPPTCVPPTTSTPPWNCSCNQEHSLVLWLMHTHTSWLLQRPFEAGGPPYWESRPGEVSPGACLQATHNGSPAVRAAAVQALAAPCAGGTKPLAVLPEADRAAVRAAVEAGATDCAAAVRAAAARAAGTLAACSPAGAPSRADQGGLFPYTHTFLCLHLLHLLQPLRPRNHRL